MLRHVIDVAGFGDGRNKYLQTNSTGLKMRDVKERSNGSPPRMRNLLLNRFDREVQTSHNKNRRARFIENIYSKLKIIPSSFFFFSNENM
jgi:hypothetical protein